MWRRTRSERRSDRRCTASDATALGTVLPALRARWTDADLDAVPRAGLPRHERPVEPAEVAQAQQALADIALRRVWNEQVGVQEEPYFATGGSDARIDDPELRIRKVWMFCQADARLAGLAAHPRLRGLLDQLIGPESRMVQDMALLKPPFHGAEKPWHQDTAYFDWTPLGGVIGVWIALDRATVENGCMQVIPGSHLPGPGPALPRPRLPDRRRSGRRRRGRRGAARTGRRALLLGPDPPWHAART